MADITITAASVAPGATTLKLKPVTYGESGITQGMPLYQSTSDSKYYKADADAVATALGAVIAMSAGGADDPGFVAIPGTEPGKALINMGATLTVGETYVVSTTAGGVAPISDLGSGDFVSIIGVATTAALLDFRMLVSNTAKA